jgi:hypothetical protein
MKVSKGTLCLLILFFSFFCHAQETSRFSTGLFVSYLLPNRYPAFESPAYNYGIKLSARIWKPVIQAQIGYTGQPGLMLLLGELNIKVPFETPYFSTFILAGLYGLYYYSDTNNNYSNQQWGIIGGFGLSLELSKNFEFEGTLKNYFQQKNLVGFSASIAYQF